MACSEPGMPRNNLIMSDWIKNWNNTRVYFWLRNIYPIAQFIYVPNIIVVKLAAVLLLDVAYVSRTTRQRIMFKIVRSA